MIRLHMGALSDFDKHSALFKTNVIEAVNSLYASKQRTLLALIGIVIGIGSVIAMVSLGLIFKEEALKQFKELGTERLSIRKLYSQRSPVQPTISLAVAENLATETPSIAASVPWVSSYEEFIYAGKIVGDGRVVGSSASFFDINKLRLESGRFLSDLDFRRYYCVLGEEVGQAMRNAGASQLVGERIKFGGRQYTIVGVLRYAPPGRDIDINGSVLIPITTAMRTLRSREIENIYARMEPDVHYTTAGADVEAYFHRISRHLNVEVVSAKQLIEQIQRQLQLITLLLGVIGSIALIVGGVGVMNVMLISVSERRKEIGIRRALGARRKDIQGQFLIESIILSLLGGLFGILLGIGGSYVTCLFTGWTFSVSAMSVVLGVGVASGVGIFFGLYPAYQAARLDPIIALRAP